MKHLLVALITACLIICGFWLYGFDLNERGATALACYIASLFFGLVAFAASKDLSD